MRGRTTAVAVCLEGCGAAAAHLPDPDDVALEAVLGGQPHGRLQLGPEAMALALGRHPALGDALRVRALALLLVPHPLRIACAAAAAADEVGVGRAGASATRTKARHTKAAELPPRVDALVERHVRERRLGELERVVLALLHLGALVHVGRVRVEDDDLIHLAIDVRRLPLARAEPQVQVLGHLCAAAGACSNG